eukprot:CAMPEP_0179001132 /NCGR_PEP_ID=MMETSP0795-20121207/11143_1 /TAXON_ID=88552 /ORGANISM="Amoebophrya sp., Strain Ameob2" /LENGTH=58 /DNA_ID=CAMNT_0020694377 /DNA_START=158 /DNA_END=334 /DNA_ORIENTATION=-
MWNIKKKAAGESDKPPAQQEPTKPTKELIWKLQVLAGFATVCAALQVAGDVTGLIEPF